MLRLYKDCAQRPMSLLLDITLPRVQAEGNVHQKAQRAMRLFPSLTTLVVTGRGAGLECGRRRPSFRPSVPHSLAAPTAARPRTILPAQSDPHNPSHTVPHRPAKRAVPSGDGADSLPQCSLECALHRADAPLIWLWLACSNSRVLIGTLRIAGSEWRPQA